MNGVNPWLQTPWDWRAAGNFIAGGTGSGLLLVTAIAGALGGPVLRPTLLSVALVMAGLGMVWLELGRPWRFLHVFFNPHTSWMTREAIVAMPLLALGLAGALTALLGLVWAAACVGMGFLYCQGRILIAAKGIPVWRTPRIMGLISTSGIAEGCGVYLLLVPVIPADSATQILPVVLTLLLVFTVGRFVAWRVYLSSLKGKAPTAALAVLNRSSPVFIVVGHILPALLIIAGIWFSEARLICSLSAGLSATVAGWAIKAVIITRAAFNQGYAIERTPARGGGESGPGTKPGWE